MSVQPISRAIWGRRSCETLEALSLGWEVGLHVDQVDDVQSFIKLRARGRCEGEQLDEHAEVGEDVAELLGEGGAGIG